MVEKKPTETVGNQHPPSSCPYHKFTSRPGSKYLCPQNDRTSKRSTPAGACVSCTSRTPASSTATNSRPAASVPPPWSRSRPPMLPSRWAAPYRSSHSQRTHFPSAVPPRPTRGWKWCSWQQSSTPPCPRNYQPVARPGIRPRCRTACVRNATAPPRRNCQNTSHSPRTHTPARTDGPTRPQIRCN